MLFRIKQWLIMFENYITGYKPDNVSLPTASELDVIEEVFIPEYIEPEFLEEYNEYTYKTELQIVWKDNQVLCSDWTDKVTNQWAPDNTLKNYHGLQMIKDYIQNAYNNKLLHTFDKSNKYHTEIPTTEIKKILYKEPTVSVQLVQVRNPKYVKHEN